MARSCSRTTRNPRGTGSHPSCVPWAANLRPAVNRITSDLGMDPTLPVWNTITILGFHDAHHGPPRVDLGVHTEIPGKHSSEQTHNSRFWVAGDKVINPPEHLRLAHRLSRVVQQFVTAAVAAPTPGKDRKPPGNRHWGNRDIPHYNIQGKPTPWQPGKSRLGATPANDSSVVTIDCTSRCGDRDIPPPPNKDTSPPIKIEGLTRAVGPTDYQDGTAVVTNGSNTTAVRIVGSDVVIPIDTGHKSSPTPPFAPGQPLRFLLRRAFITVGSATRDDFVVAYQPQPVSPVDPHAASTEWRTVPAPDYLPPDAAIFAEAARLGTTPTGKHHIVATTAPTHPFWVGPREKAVRLPISKLDSAAEANCISWDVYTGIRDNLEAAGCPLLTSESVSLQGAHGNSRATIFGTVKNIPIFLHENQSDPVFVDFVVMNGNSPVLLGAPFMDDYFQLIHIECRYFAFYTTPRATRELDSGDYSAELMKVPYIIQSRAIVLQSTASVHQVLNINAATVIVQDMPQGESPDAPRPSCPGDAQGQAGLSSNTFSASSRPSAGSLLLPSSTSTSSARTVSHHHSASNPRLLHPLDSDLCIITAVAAPAVNFIDASHWTAISASSPLSQPPPSTSSTLLTGQRSLHHHRCRSPHRQLHRRFSLDSDLCIITAVAAPTVNFIDASHWTAISASSPLSQPPPSTSPTLLTGQRSLHHHRCRSPHRQLH